MQGITIHNCHKIMQEPVGYPDNATVSAMKYVNVSVENTAFKVVAGISELDGSYHFENVNCRSLLGVSKDKRDLIVKGV